MTYAPPSLLAYSSSILSSYSLSFSFCCSSESVTSWMRPCAFPSLPATRRPVLSTSKRSSRGAWPGSWTTWWTRVPLGSECVDWLYEVVWPLFVLEYEDDEVE
jgi:hypothetical protein